MTGAFPTFFGIRVYTSKYVGDLVTPTPPQWVFTKGPYMQRRRKRWNRRHPPYYVANGTMLVSEREGYLVCHPADLPTLLEALRQASVPKLP